MKRRWDHDTATALASTDVMVRAATVENLRFLPKAEFALHAGAIVNALTDADHRVRCAAARILTTGYLEQAAVTLHVGAIVGFLSHPVHCVRQVAMLTISKLEVAFEKEFI